MASPTSDSVYRNSPMALSDFEIAAVVVLANKEYDGNRSMAVRNMIRHYVRCQFPLLGLSPEIEQPTVELAK